jgi:hypothetical protein
MGWCGKFFLFFFCLYLTLCLYTFYRILYPSECQSLPSSVSNPSLSFSLSSSLSPSLLSAFQQSCYQPLWGERERERDRNLNQQLAVNIKMFIGREKPEGDAIWSIENHLLSEQLQTEIIIPKSFNYSSSDRQINCWMTFIRSNIAKKTKKPEIIFQYPLAEQRPIKESHSQRYLLDPENQNHSPSMAEKKTLHWKFLHSPIVLRYVPFYTTVELKTYQEIFLQKMKKRKNPSQVEGSTNYVYEPMLWLDDLAITSRHFSPSSGSSETIRVQFHYLPTSLPYYYLKYIFSLILSCLISILSLSPSAFQSLLSDQTALASFLANLSSNSSVPHEYDAFLDDLRYYLSDDHLYLLFLSSLISYIHLYLDYLILSSDYRYFVSTNRKHNFSGVSVSSHLYTLYKSIVTYLYLSHFSSSYLILFSVGKDICYTSWKVYQILFTLFLHNSSFRWKEINIFVKTISFPIGYAPLPKMPPDTPTSSDSQSNPDPDSHYIYYDYLATLHSLLITFPLFVGLSIYSLSTYTYTSWYSFILFSLMDSIYYFGFIAMIPQLYINYRLRSVAHLPLHVLFYKLFQTVVDDIFAFLIKMPWKHKIMTLRDDIIFLIFLYQWWIYPSDKTRVNEYGYQYEKQNKDKVETKEESLGQSECK